MKELVEILDTIGYENIQTYIQSGNAVFRSREKVGMDGASAISREILRKKGFEPKVLLLSVEQLQDAIKNNPFPTNDGKALHFFFLELLPHSPSIEQLDSLKIESEKFELKDKVFYLYAPEGIGRSKLAATVEKLIGVPVTARNWNTINKLISMVSMIKPDRFV